MPQYNGQINKVDRVLQDQLTGVRVERDARAKLTNTWHMVTGKGYNIIILYWVHPLLWTIQCYPTVSATLKFQCNFNN